MPRNGSGVYSLPPGINPVVTQTLITSNWANTTMTDVANALTNSVAADGQTVMTGNLKMGGFQVNGLGAPTTASAAVSLSYVQAGTQFRLSNVSGVNALTATLAGGASAFTLGQLVELIPASTNTGPVTLNVNGVGVVPLVTSLGKPLGNTSLQAGGIYLLGWDGAQWRVLTSPNALTFAQSSISGWDRPAGGTYPLMAMVNANTVSVPAGSGRIVAPGARDQAGVTEVSWVAQNVGLTNIPNAWATTLAVNSAGAIVQLVGIIQAQWARQYIILGTVAHMDGQIDGIVNQPAIFGDAAYESFDLGVLFHNTITAGGQVVPSANTLHMDVLAGRMWLAGGNANNANQPNFIDFANQVNITLYPSTATNVVAAATQAVPVSQYDPAGAGVVTPIPVPLSQAVIHRLFLMAGQYVLCYGQTLYPDLNTAIQSINNDNATFKPPGKLVGATLFAYICATANCTNLNDGIGGRIVGANAVSATSGGGAGVSEAPLDGNAYARLNGAWWRSIFLDPNYNAQLGNNAKADGISLSLNAAAATNRQLNFQSSGINRFSLIVANTAEPGANVGADISANVYADNGAFIISPFTIARATGFITFPPGVVTVGMNTLATPARLWLNAAAAAQKKVQYQSAGSVRWEVGSDSDAETGSNTGSSLYIQSFTDAGAGLQRIMTINRATGNVTFGTPVTLSGAYGYFGVPDVATNMVTSPAGWTAAKSYGTWFTQNAEYSTGAWKSQNTTNTPCVLGLTAAGGLSFLASATVPASVGAAVTFAPAMTVDKAGNTMVAGNVGTNGITAQAPLDVNIPGSGRVLFRNTGSGNTIDSVNPANGAYAPLHMTTTGLTHGAPLVNNGQITVNASVSNAGDVIINDPNGPHLKFMGQTGTYPNKWIRGNGNNLEFVNSGYTQVSFAINDYGTANSVTVTGGSYPASDNAWPTGSSGTRWSTVYAASGAVNASDAREKTPLAPLTKAELRASMQLAEMIGTYQWLYAIEAKGADKARHHCGITTQGAIAVMEANGLDPFAYGFICYDEWDEIRNSHVPELRDEDGNIIQEEKPLVTPAGNRYSMRYEELAMFIARGEHERLKAIEALLNI